MRTAHRAPVGQQFIERLGVDHRARQDMRADFRALFEDADRKLASRVIRTLLEPDRRRQPRWTGADDHHVIRHRFTFAHKISPRSEEHTSELQSLMRNSYAVFCLKKKNTHHHYY